MKLFIKVGPGLRGHKLSDVSMFKYCSNGKTGTSVNSQWTAKQIVSSRLILLKGHVSPICCFNAYFSNGKRVPQ